MSSELAFSPPDSPTALSRQSRRPGESTFPCGAVQRVCVCVCAWVQFKNDTVNTGSGPKKRTEMLSPWQRGSGMGWEVWGGSLGTDGSVPRFYGTTRTWTRCQALLSTPRRFQMGATVSGCTL